MGDLPYLDLVANGHKFFLTQQMLQGLPYLPGLELVLGSIPRVVYISLPNTAFPTYTESMSKLLR